jgi:YD repeat-containing protein
MIFSIRVTHRKFMPRSRPRLYVDRPQTRSMCSILFIAVISCGLLFTLPLPDSNAQAIGTSQLKGTAARAIGQKWKVRDSSADLYAGPSVAYSKRGRVYESEEVTIKRVTPNQEWVEVTTSNGVKGWIKTISLARPQDNIATDPGRQRRQTEYKYDAQGRRLSPNGAPMGSGQGMPSSTGRPDSMRQGRAPQNPVGQGAVIGGEMGDGGRDAFKRFGVEEKRVLSIQVSPGGVTQLKRRFTSDIVGASPLAGYEAQTLSYQYSLGVVWRGLKHLHLSAQWVNARGSTVSKPPHPLSPNAPAQELSSSQSQAELLAHVGLPVGPGWIGLSVGAQYLARDFQEVAYPEPYTGYATLQSHSYMSLLGGLIFTWPMGPMNIELGGGALLPLSFTQTPRSIGKWSALGYQSRLKLSFTLSPLISIGVYGLVTQIGADLKGPADYLDPFFGQPRVYLKASTYDMSAGGGALLEINL